MTQGHTITVETIEEHTYDGVLHKVGDRYEAEEGHIDFLGLRGFARPATTPAPAAGKAPAAKPPARK